MKVHSHGGEGVYPLFSLKDELRSATVELRLQLRKIAWFLCVRTERGNERGVRESRLRGVNHRNKGKTIVSGTWGGCFPNKVWRKGKGTDVDTLERDVGNTTENTEVCETMR